MKNTNVRYQKSISSATHSLEIKKKTQPIQSHITNKTNLLTHSLFLNVFGNVHMKVVKLRLWQIRWPTVYLTSYSVKNTQGQLLQGAVSFRALKHLGSNLHSTHSNTLPINSNSLCDISQELRLLDWELQNALVWHVAMLVKSYIPLVPFSMQSMPRAGLFSFTWRAFTSVNVWIGDRPEFSASARGTLSSASEKARNAYCSREEIWQMRMLHVLYTNTDQL